MMLRVRLLGRPELARPGGPAGPQPRGRKSWALLARVSLADRPLHRRELAGELFADADDPLGALRWCLADLRRGLQAPDALKGELLAVPELWVDARELAAGREVAELGGTLLEGIDLADCPAFETWLLLARSRTTARTAEVLRARVLHLLTSGDTRGAVDVAERAAVLDPLDESAQELLLRALVQDGRPGLAAAHLAACEGTFTREGLSVSPALRAAAQDRLTRPTTGVRAGVVALSLLQAGRAALDAGAADGGIETLRRAADDAARAGDPGLEADVLLALGAALVHAVRGSDGEGALVLHRGLRAAREAGLPAVAAEALRELAHVDVQAGRHSSAEQALRDAEDEARDDPELAAGLLALRGMNEADRGRHASAIVLLTDSAERAGRPRQRVWSLGVLARSLLLNGQPGSAQAAAEAAVEGAREQRWNAFLPWPQAILAECHQVAGRWGAARAEAEQAFALGCELGDPCWEGMSARVLAVSAAQAGDTDAAWSWVDEARRRSDRVPDRYVWVSAYVGLAQLELASRCDPARVPELARQLHRDAVHADLPEFQAWALLHLARSGDPTALAPARELARHVDNPGLQASVREPLGPSCATGSA